jgi:hypothetical protein
MSWCSRPEVWGAALLAAAAQGAAAQVLRERQLFTVAVASDPAVGAVGAGLAWRDRGRSRIGAAVAAGAGERGGAAGRAELAWHFLLDPTRARGAGVYGGGGLAVTAFPDGRLRPWVLLVVGVEGAPALRRGTFFELGVGGGVRVAAGVRFRNQSAPSR